MTAPPITAPIAAIRAALVEMARPYDAAFSDADLNTLINPNPNWSPRVYPPAVVDGVVCVIGDGGTPRIHHNNEPYTLDEHYRELATLPATHPVGYILRTTHNLFK